MGARHSYFAHPEFETFAPGLKSLADAVAIRNRVLAAFEQAEAEEDPKKHRDLLTFVLVGAGPTGVEMAGALAVLVRSTLRRDFRRRSHHRPGRPHRHDAQGLGTFADSFRPRPRPG
jgi:NADH dehydrogenase FAD-containing subunit